MATKNESNKGDSKGRKRINKQTISKEIESKIKGIIKDRIDSQRHDQKKIKEKIENIEKRNPEKISENVVNTFFAKDLELARVEVKLKKFNRKRENGQSPKTRIRKSPKKEAFNKWVREYKIDTKLSLDRLTHDIEEAYLNGEVEMKIGRDTVRECLKKYRSKN